MMYVPPSFKAKVQMMKDSAVACAVVTFTTTTAADSTLNCLLTFECICLLAMKVPSPRHQRLVTVKGTWLAAVECTWLVAVMGTRL